MNFMMKTRKTEAGKGENKVLSLLKLFFFKRKQATMIINE